MKPPQPDGSCHAAVTEALVRTCPFSAPAGRWSCPLHRAELEARAEEIRQATRPLDRST